MTISDPERLESLIQTWSTGGDLVQSIRQALDRTDDHPALALWAYQDEQVGALLTAHRKIAGWVDILRQVVPAEAWRPEWARLLNRLPAVLRMWVLQTWSRRWLPESDFWAGCLNDATVLQWLLQWSRQDSAWQVWVVQRAHHIRSDRMRRKILPEAPQAAPPLAQTEAPNWEVASSVHYVTPINGRYYWLIRYTSAASDAWAILGLRTQVDHTVQDAVLVRLDSEDRTELFRTSHPSYQVLFPYLMLQHPALFEPDLNLLTQGRFRRRTIRLESASPFIIQALEHTPRDAWPFYLRTYAAAFVDPWLRWDATPELGRVRDLLKVSVFSATETAQLPFSHSKEAASFLVHLFNVLWGYHAPDEMTRLVDWLDTVTQDLRRSSFLERFIERYRGSVFAPVPPRLSPEVRQALAKAYLLVQNRPLDEAVAAGIKTLLTWTLQDLADWVRSLARTTASPS
ncbi:MAG: hypothetical protein NZ742_06865, partial [Acidobacteria bacterium]|nr:hypothetical protein [Acidobacteriota bacterium]MDW7983703.1 hypothetical protein [Acidobacteriota bacterium]